MPLLWLLDPPPLVTVDEPPADCPWDDTAGLLYVGWLPVTDFDVVVCLREVVDVPTVPRPVLLLVPVPRFTVVLLSVPTLEPDAVTRSGACVSLRGPYHLFFEKCPPLPIPGPWPCPW